MTNDNELTPEERAVMSRMGKKGGSAKGPQKARPSDQMRAAGVKGAAIRWAGHKKATKP